jgi:hypothetical protein
MIILMIVLPDQIITMGWFDGNSGGDNSSSGLDLSSGSGADYGSKLRSPSSEMDLSDFSPSPDSSGGDIQMHLQREQQKAMLMSAVSFC